VLLRFRCLRNVGQSQAFGFHIIYVGVNAIAPGRRSRTKEAISAVRHVFLEADHDGQQVLTTIAARGDLPPPSYVLHSSPNRVARLLAGHRIHHRTHRTAAEASGARAGYRPARHTGLSVDTAFRGCSITSTCRLTG
jgi:hypothetical protein